jgi:predicted nucleotidyltransferase
MIALTTQQLEAIGKLCREFQVTKLELFGSATRADFDPECSDIDMLVDFAPGTDLGPWMSRFFDLQGRLEIVLGRKVDLVMANALRNPYLIRSINRDRRVLYAA